MTGVEFLDVSRVFDETGRFSPRFVEGSESVLPSRHRPRRDRTDRGLFLPPTGGRDRDARRADHDRSGDARDDAPRASTREATPRSALASRSMPSPTASAAPFRSTSSSVAGLARRPRWRSRSTCTTATKATLDYEGIPRQAAADAADLAPHRHRRGRGVLPGARGAARGNALPPLLDEHDLRGEPGRGHRVHSLRRLPGHLPGGLHRDPPLGARDARFRRPRASWLPFSSDGVREGSDPHQGRRDVHPLRPLRRALPRRHHHHAELPDAGGRPCLKNPRRRESPRSGRNQPARLPDPGRRWGLRRGGAGLARRHPRLPEAEGALRASHHLPRGQRGRLSRRGRCASTGSSAPT